ncbi:MAG: cupredoxin domain-containing protein [Polyangiaceae bacterium]
MRARHPAAVLAALLASSALVGAGACNRTEASVPLADVTANEHGFTPSSMKLAAGGPGSHTTVTFVRTSDKTCATEVVFPDLHIEKKLPLDQVVAVDLPTDQARTLTFQCGMAMYKGSVVVTAK